jgi:hypothetical protein
MVCQIIGNHVSHWCFTFSFKIKNYLFFKTQISLTLPQYLTLLELCDCMNFMHLFVVKQVPAVCCQSLHTHCDMILSSMFISLFYWIPLPLESICNFLVPLIQYDVMCWRRLIDQDRNWGQYVRSLFWGASGGERGQ